MLKDYYAMKDINETVVVNKEKEIKIDTIKSVDILKIGKHQVLIIGVDIINDEIENVFKTFKRFDLKFKMGCKYYYTGERSYKDREFNNMRFIKSIIPQSFDKATKFLYVFADCQYWKVKGELNTYLSNLLLIEGLTSIVGDRTVRVNVGEISRDVELRVVKEVAERYRCFKSDDKEVGDN